MNRHPLALLLLIAAAGTGLSACKTEEPGAVEQLEEKVKDGLDLRENEKLKDAGEDLGDALKNAGEAAKEALPPSEEAPPK